MSKLTDEIRDAYRVRDGYWFAPKMFGLGATPVTWQGWALLVGFVAAVLAVVASPIGDVAKGIVVAVLIATLIYISWRKTDGGWGWRWGGER